MVVAQLFEVTVAADGTELSSKRVSKLSRRYHRHKKQLRQSAMMAEVSSDAWVCPILLRMQRGMVQAWVSQKTLKRDILRVFSMSDL